MKKRALIFLFIPLMLIFDQATKYLAQNLINPSQAIELLPFFQLVNVRNEGAAFGLFSSLGNKFFIALSAIAIVAIIFLLIKEKDSTLSLSLILSGASGNLIDRLFFGYVRDFIDVFVGKYHWPAFNVADSCLTIGIIMLIAMPALKKMKGSSK